jgi:hypothetical protein
VVRTVRENISVLEGSGGNIAVLTGAAGSCWLTQVSPGQTFRQHWTASATARSDMS